MGLKPYHMNGLQAPHQHLFVEAPITELDGKEVGGRTLKVNEARPKPERSGPRRDDGGRGGFSRDDYSGSVRKLREPRW